MMHTKIQGYRPIGSREEENLAFTIYGHGVHLGHVTRAI